MKQIELLDKVNVRGYKQSYYNTFWSFDEENVVGYNFMYRNMLLFDKNDYQMLQKGEDKIIKHLIEHNFLVDENFNEIEFYKYSFYKTAYNDSILTLIILPTLNCNLSCPYCYENKSNIKMTKEVEENLLEWIESNLVNKRILAIDWFGGEPLLCIETIERLSNEIIKLCEKHNVYYEASITTNGYLLKEEIIEKLNQLHIKTVQITFDGNKTAHDKQKFISHDKGTFDVLMHNVEKYCELSKSNRPLRIRVNASDDNFDTISELLDSFSDNVKSSSFIFFRWLYPNEASDWKMFSKEKKGNSAYKGIANLLQMAAEKGFHIDNRCDKLQFSYCEADAANYFTIDPQGYIYLCVHDYQPKDAIGNLKEGISPTCMSYYHSFKNVNPFDDEECLTCKVLPICNGGCRKKRLQGNKECIEEKQETGLYVKNLYDKYLKINV